MREYRKRYLPFEEKFIIFSDRIEKIVIKVAIVFFIILLSAQFIISFDAFRDFFVPLESIEGAIEFSETYTQTVQVSHND